MRISDWSSDVCSSDLRSEAAQLRIDRENCCKNVPHDKLLGDLASSELCAQSEVLEQAILREAPVHLVDVLTIMLHVTRSEEHTSELQSLMRISYAVF